MKKILITLIVLLLGFNVFADTKQPTIKFNGTTYTLKNSSYSNETKSYINEYYKDKENKNNFTDTIIIYHIKSYKKPFIYAKDLAKLASTKTPVDTKIMYNKSQDIAITNIIMLTENNKNRYLEQSLYKIEKPLIQKGIIVFQFTHKYKLNTEDDAINVKLKLPINQQKWLEEINKTIIPDIIEKEIK